MQSVQPTYSYNANHPVSPFTSLIGQQSNNDNDDNSLWKVNNDYTTKCVLFHSLRYKPARAPHTSIISVKGISVAISL